MAPLIEETNSYFEMSSAVETNCSQAPRPPSPLTNSMEKSQRRVRFHDVVFVQQIHNKNDLSQEERSACWLQTCDFQAMHLERQRTLRAAIFGDLNGDNSALRGMETLLPKSATQRRQNIQTALAVVRKEQQRARAQGFSCPSHMSFIYSNATQRSKQAAHIQALEDHFEALR